MNRVPLLIFLSCFFCCLLLVSCGQPETKQKQSAKRKRGRSITQTKFVKPKPVAQGYVGSESCRQCHAEIMKEYESHAMSISMSVTRDFQIEQYPTPDPVNAGNGTTWSANNENNAVAHTEEVKSTDGNKLFDHEEKIDFTCGSGTRGCSYFCAE